LNSNGVPPKRIASGKNSPNVGMWKKESSSAYSAGLRSAVFSSISQVRATVGDGLDGHARSRPLAVRPPYVRRWTTPGRSWVVDQPSLSHGLGRDQVSSALGSITETH